MAAWLVGVKTTGEAFGAFPDPIRPVVTASWDKDGSSASIV